MLIKRNQYLENIRRFYESNLIKVLTGVRGCGKSVLLNQIKEELINEKGIRGDHIISINFEDVKFSKIKNYNHIYCLWVACSFKGKGIRKELLEYAI